MKRIIGIVALIFALLLSGLLLFSRIAVEQLLAPRQSEIILPTTKLYWEQIALVANDRTVSGWYYQGDSVQPVVLLLHGIGESRLSLFDEAELLAKRNWSVLIIDLPGHGESPAPHITLGVTESESVFASYWFLRKRNPLSKIGAIGFSLGGASLVLGDSIPPFDAVVLESVYSTIEQAVANRMKMRVGILGKPLAFFMKLQMKWVIGIDSERISPLEKISQVHVPILVVAGEKDERTLLWESEKLFTSANEPKHRWFVSNMGHEHGSVVDSIGYEQNVISFLKTYLQ